jgi:diacylglycerol O-acyltransferase
MTEAGGAMAERRRLGIQDALWLEMDRPNNLMVVDSVIWTAEPLDFSALRAVVEERLLDRYPVFRSRAVCDEDGSWWWEPDPDFNFDNHVSLVSLQNPDDPSALQDQVAAHRTEMLNRDHPLWQSIWIRRYGEGSAMILRSHHAIADGMRMVQLAMSLFDASADGGPVMAPAVIQAGAVPHPPGQSLARRVRSGAVGVARTATGALGRIAEAPRLLEHAGRLGRFVLRNPVGAGATLVTAAKAGAADIAGTVRVAVPGGGTLVDVFSAVPGDVDTVRKLLLGTRNDATMWTGTAGGDKSVAWSEALPLAAIKALARANHSTVNDVLMACVAGALHDYLRAHEAPCSSVTFMVPVNLKPLDLTLPDTLGNDFALVQLELPTDEPDPIKLLAAAKRRMDRIKHGHEAALAFRFQETIAGFSRGLYEASVDLFANRTLGTLTNVPGPPMPVYLAGSLVEGIVGWAPISGDQPMSFTLSSYNGKVMAGIACDTELVPDHEMIVEGFVDAFERLADATPGVVLMPVSWGRAGKGPWKGPGKGQGRRR